MAFAASSTSENRNAEAPIRVNAGLGVNSYFKHSSWQRIAARGVKEVFDEAIMKKLDIKSMLSTSSTIRLADLGCAVGPNTFTSMQDMIDIVKKKYKTQCPNFPIPEIQVFFNDQPSNDFNTLFTNLPKEREYFAAGVPGSFFGRLFPESSLHVVQACYALHWISRAPEELLDRSSPAWNKGKIHYTSAPDAVLKAYATQWAKDVNDFLNARAKEMVAGGMLVVVMQSVPDGMPYSELANGITYNHMATILYDMANRGLISQEEVDTFNLPLYAAPPAEFVAAVEKNEHFKIEEIGLTNPAPWLSEDEHVDMNVFVRHIRAAMEGMFLKRFPPHIVNEMFDKLAVKLCEISDEMHSAYRDKIQAHYVLQRI